MTIVVEALALIQAALEGDPALTSLKVVGATPGTLKAHIALGTPAKEIGGTAYLKPPFRREILVALIIHTQRLRWQRAAPLSPLAVPPLDTDLQALHKKHRRATVSFECWPGWADLLDATFAWLDEVASDSEWQPVQIKEKFGSLRFYWRGDLPPLGAEIIDAAEHLSGHICEVCGSRGTLQSQRGWWSTRCPDHKHWRPA